MKQKKRMVLFYPLMALALLANTSSWAEARGGDDSSNKARPYANARRMNDDDGQFRFGLGYAQFGNFGSRSEAGSLSAVFDINGVHSFQLTFGVSSVTNTFNFGSGLIYRATVAGNRTHGFHVGALVNMGSHDSGVFTIRMGPLLGIHFAPFETSHIQFSLDGGPMYTYESNKSDLNLGPVGPGFMGLSVHYFF